MSLIKTPSFTLAIYSQGDPNADKFALVVPGKLDTKDYAHMKSHVNFLSKLGYFAVSFDPPGTWESPGNISLYNTTNTLKAVDEIITYFGNKPTFMMGHSRGAGITMIAASKNPYITSYAAVMSPLGTGGFLENLDQNWEKNGYKISMRDLPPGSREETKEFRLPYSFYKDQLKYDLTDEILKCAKPKLITVGKNDPIVSPDRVRETYKLLAEPKVFYELDSDHDYRLNDKLIDKVNLQIKNFLEKF